jgi:hypothetical protein
MSRGVSRKGDTTSADRTIASDSGEEIRGPLAGHERAFNLDSMGTGVYVGLG